MEPLISVIIPVYNMEAYLARCLDTIITNTYQNLEILCVDDGSKDNSLEILQEYGAKDPRIVVIAKENGGVSSARNAGLDRMTGKYVTFVDPDDFVHPQYFELLLKARELSGADVIVGNHQKTSDINTPNDYQTFSLCSDDVSVQTLKQANKKIRTTSYCWCKLLPTEIVGETRFENGISFAEDTLFLLELWSRRPTVRFGYLNCVLYYYFQGRRDSLALTGRDRYAVPYVSYLAEKASASREDIYLEQAIRRGTYYRYYYTFIKKDRQIVKQLGVILRGKIKQICRSGLFSGKEAFFQILFILSPRLDRLHRLYRDPNLKKDEAEKKNYLVSS